MASTPAPDAPSVVSLEVSPLGRYLLCALAGAVVGVVLGVALRSLMDQYDTLPPDMAYAPLEEPKRSPEEIADVFAKADEPATVVVKDEVPGTLTPDPEG